MIQNKTVHMNKKSKMWDWEGGKAKKVMCQTLVRSHSEVGKAEHGPLPPGLGNLPSGTGSGKSHTRILR